MPRTVRPVDLPRRASRFELPVIASHRLYGLLALLSLAVLSLLLNACQGSTSPIVPALPADATPAQATYDQRIQLVGYQLDPSTLEPGDDVRLTLFFKLLAPLKLEAGPLKLLFQVTRACAGKNVAVLQVPLGGKGFKPAQWQVGQILRQHVELEIPQSLNSETASLWVTLEQGKQRFAVTERERVDLRQRFRLVDLPVSWKAPMDLPTYVVHQASGRIIPDGRLDEPAWQAAPPSSWFVYTDGKEVDRDRTRARLLWDDQNLYVGLEVEDRDLYSTYTRHDEALYEQEVVEIYLDPDGDGRTYHELQVSPANVTFDVYYPECREDMELSWESGLKTGVNREGTLNNAADEDKGWTVEMVIPLASLKSVPHLPLKAGDRWRGNLYRLDKRGRNHKQNVGSSWSPTYTGDYHTPTRWGYLQFER